MQKPFPPYKPYQPIKPSQPSQLINLIREIIVIETDNEKIVSLQNVLDQIDDLNIDISQISFKIMVDDNGDYGGWARLLICYPRKNVENPDYENELIRYNSLLNEYNKEFEKYNKEYEKFKIKYKKYEFDLKKWNDEETDREIKRLEKKLTQAKEDEKKLAKLKAKTK